MKAPQAYKVTLRKLRIELVKRQRHVIACKVVLFDRRGTIAPASSASWALHGAGIRGVQDISRAEQRRRLKERRGDSLTQLKSSPIDDVAMKHWRSYSRAPDEVLARRHSSVGPWTVVGADDERHARMINLIRDLLGRLHNAHKDPCLVRPDRRIVCAHDPSDARSGRLARCSGG